MENNYTWNSENIAKLATTRYFPKELSPVDLYNNAQLYIRQEFSPNGFFNLFFLGYAFIKLLDRNVSMQRVKTQEIKVYKYKYSGVTGSFILDNLRFQISADASGVDQGQALTADDNRGRNGPTFIVTSPVGNTNVALSLDKAIEKVKEIIGA